MPQDESIVRITLRDVYEVAVRTEQTVALLVQTDKTRAEMVKEHSARIRDLEKKVWALPSLATLIALGSFVVNLVRQV